MVEWPIDLAPWIDDVAPGSTQDFMYVVEILVAVAPRWGAVTTGASP
jgi:hypothetical protein